MSHHVLFDLSRLLSRAERSVPTGIDRVEMAYAEHALATDPQGLAFVGMLTWGRFGLLGKPWAVELIETLARAWRSDPPDTAAVARAAALARRLRIERLWRGGLGLGAGVRRAGSRAVYLHLSHQRLERAALIAALKRRADALFVCMVHDLLPLEFPEYVRPGHAARHVQRMTTVAELADLVIANSGVTRDALQSFCARVGRSPPVLVAPLGVDASMRASDIAAPDVPYFVCVGTIEPRKNHLLVLNVWRRLAIELGPAAPRLVLVGQRGWENEQVIDMIERSPAVRGLVDEKNDLSDAAMARLLTGAVAALVPSFGEGYGLPVVEALALGVPVLCSDIAAFREVAGGTAEFLDPLDGPAWCRAIVDYVQPGSPRRAAQCARLAAWRRPTWSDHFAAVDAMIDEIVARSARV
ncbi:MAG TPA: glycosyltransferase family 1 protein [Candidatus Sulfotelmatobacter sp.]|nr:glycosyltransferase family 1 protein [Candidatus Sulfotelmatobacter sp.]